MLFENPVTISFGDCDPAGIIYYPNYYRWFDATYHNWLNSHGLSFLVIRERLDTMGTGLVQTGADFLSPGQPGDRLVIQLVKVEWANKTFRLIYRGNIGERLVVEGFEVRGVFRWQENRLRAAQVAPLRELLVQHGVDL